MGDMDGDGVNDLVVGSTGAAAQIEWFKVTQTPQPEAYQDWLAERSMSGHSAAPEADWDHDLCSNWAEFAFGSDPLMPDPGHPGKPHIQLGLAGPALVFQRRADAEAKGLLYRSLISLDLRAWSPWESVSPQVSPVDEDYERVVFPVESVLERAFFKVEPEGENLE